MREVWVNDGEPDEDGNITAYIENTQGVRVSQFTGKSLKEVADLLLKSQVNANRKISQLQRPDRAVQPPPITPRDTTVAPADRMRLASELSDPDRVVEAVTEIVTAANGGVPPRAVTQNVATMTDEQQAAYYLREAEAFKAENPEYYPVPQNQDKLIAALKANLWDITRNNLGIVFQTLYDQGQMIPWPNGESESQPALPAPTNGQQREASPPPSPTNGNSRPRSISTGLRSRDANALPPAPPPRKKLTRADLEAMPRAEYEANLRNSEFRKQVDALGSA